MHSAMSARPLLFSSTENRDVVQSGDQEPSCGAWKSKARSSASPVLTGRSRDWRSATRTALLRERKESKFSGVTPSSESNRKDKLKTSNRLLFKPANTSEMRRFADWPRQRNEAADEQVMDRGAECVAGGYDAV